MSPRSKVRISTAVRFPPDLHDRLKVAAEERVVSVNWLVNRAVEHFLKELPDAEEFLTSEGIEDRQPSEPWPAAESRWWNRVQGRRST